MNSKNTEVLISIRNPCNYSCYYCCAGTEPQQLITLNLEKITSFYESLEGFVLTSLECGKGEPALHPQIRDLLTICATKGMISIPSNGSVLPKKWLPSNASSIYLRAALHPQAENNIQGFIDRLLEARNMGAHIAVTFILHPTRIDLAKKCLDLFSAQKIKLTLVAFVGTFNGKEYPMSHNEEERKLIGESTGWIDKIQCDVKNRKFAGIPCLAGFRSIYITPSGSLRRCLHDPTEIEKPFTSAQPCRISGSCGRCGWLLEELNSLSPEFWNYWRSLANLPLIPSDGLTDDQIYQKNLAKYFELMKRYGKEC